eukprot:1460589-Amphidinium_carterae.1
MHAVVLSSVMWIQVCLDFADLKLPGVATPSLPQTCSKATAPISRQSAGLEWRLVAHASVGPASPHTEEAPPSLKYKHYTAARATGAG